MNIMQTPKEMELSITAHCNLRCKYCAHFSSASDVAADLPIKEWFTFFEELNRLAVMKVTLSGGEPFLREDLKELISGIVKNRMRFSILSNGTLITDEIAQFLTKSRRCDSVQVSIDGSIPTTHDAMRGVGSFKRATEGIKTLKRHGVSVAVRVTIHKQNVSDLENIARFLLEDLGLGGFGTNSASYMGLCRKNKEQVQLSAEDRSLAMETLLKLCRLYPGRISALAGPLAEANHWLIMESARVKKQGRMPDRGYLTGCGGMNQKLAVRADGVIVPCAQLSHIEFGRINRDSLLEIWKSHPELNKLRERRLIPLSSLSYCQDCAYINYCTGNCPALAYSLLGEVNHPSPDACLKRFLEEGGSLPDERLLTV